jgi:hypothetical protein
LALVNGTSGKVATEPPDKMVVIIDGVPPSDSDGAGTADEELEESGLSGIPGAEAELLEPTTGVGAVPEELGVLVEMITLPLLEIVVTTTLTGDDAVG